MVRCYQPRLSWSPTTGVLRLIVVHELPQHENNALLHLFSARADLLGYGATRYKQRSEETSTVLLQLFQRYHLEAVHMPDVLKQFAKETIADLLRDLPIEERLQGVPLEKRLQGSSVDDLLAALSPEMRAALTQRIKEQTATPTTGTQSAKG